MAKNLLEPGFDAASLTWTPKQMHHLSNSEKAQVSSLIADASSADCLVESFQAQ
jgi:hypothetical protein